MPLPITYFGSVGWYSALLNGSDAAVSGSDIYRKQTDRNRCRIATANGVQLLTVPVTLPSDARGGRCAVRDVRVSDHGNWRHLHWQALQAAYGMSPFFDYYADDLRPFFEKRWEWLFDYNMEIITTVLRLLGSDVTVDIVDAPATVPFSALDAPDIRYYQTFQRRHGFIPDMSVVDLLCNEGPEGIVRLTRNGR